VFTALDVTYMVRLLSQDAIYKSFSVSISVHAHWLVKFHFLQFFVPSNLSFNMSSQSKDGLLAVCGSLLGLSTIAVGLRFYARKKTHLPIKADDMLAVASLVCARPEGCGSTSRANTQRCL
jgi:hypothetical protein